MEFEITQTLNFEIENLTDIIINVADTFLSDYDSDYGKLDNNQRDLLLTTIFSKAVEILKN